MVGCSPQWLALCWGNRALPYTTMPGAPSRHARCASSRVAQRGGTVAQAALAGRVPCRGGVEGRHLVRNARGPSASLKWVMNEISSTCGSALSQRPRGAVALGREARRRFMPEFILRNTRVRHLGLVRGQHVDLLVAVHRMPRPRREHSSRSRGSNTPSSSRMGPRQPGRARAGLGQVQQRKAVGAAQAFVHRARCHGRRRWP